LHDLRPDGRIDEAGQQHDGGSGITLSDHPGGVQSVRRIGEPEIKQAGIGFVLGYRGDPQNRGGRNRQHLMTARFKRDAERLTQDPVVVTKNKPHRLRPLQPLRPQLRRDQLREATG
jgi:hypothetical protein